MTEVIEKDCDTSVQPKDFVDKSVTEEMQADAVISATTAILIEQTEYLAIHIQRPTRNRGKRNVNNIPTNTDNRAPIAQYDGKHWWRPPISKKGES